MTKECLQIGIKPTYIFPKTSEQPYHTEPTLIGFGSLLVTKYKIFTNSVYLKSVNTTNVINLFLMPKPLDDEDDKNNVKIANIKRFLIIPTQKLQNILSF